MAVQLNGISETKKALAAMAGQLPFATSLALNRMGKQTLGAQRIEMQRRFDRPTPYTLNSLFKTTATKTSLETRTRIKSPNPSEAGQTEKRYVGVQIFGGNRKDKASERRLRAAGLLPAGWQMVPGAGLRLDRYGNVPGGRVAAILQSLLGGTSYTSAAGTYVVGQVGGTKGIWKVQRNKWVPIFIFVKRPTYEPLLDYYGVSEQEFQKNWSEIFSQAIDDALRSAR